MKDFVLYIARTNKKLKIEETVKKCILKEISTLKCFKIKFYEVGKLS